MRRLRLHTDSCFVCVSGAVRRYGCMRCLLYFYVCTSPEVLGKKHRGSGCEAHCHWNLSDPAPSLHLRLSLSSSFSLCIWEKTLFLTATDTSAGWDLLAIVTIVLGGKKIYLSRPVHEHEVMPACTYGKSIQKHAQMSTAATPSVLFGHFWHLLYHFFRDWSFSWF